MTVKELIEELSQLDSKTTVYIADCRDFHNYELTHVGQVKQNDELAHPFVKKNAEHDKSGKIMCVLDYFGNSY